MKIINKIPPELLGGKHIPIDAVYNGKIIRFPDELYLKIRKGGNNMACSKGKKKK